MKKYKLFIDCVLVLLCLFPLIVTLFLCLHNQDISLIGDFSDVINNFNISNTVSEKVFNALNSVGFSLDGSYGSSVSIILSNSILIYLFYVFIEVLVFVPKMAIKLLRIGVRKDD